MKKGKLLSVLAVAGAGLLACTSSKGTYVIEGFFGNRVLKKTYNTWLSYPPSSFDYAVSGRGEDSDHFANFVDGLYEADRYGINYTPALAKARPTITDGGLTYTIQIKDNLKWVDYNGAEKYTVTAKDWETTAKRVLDYRTYRSQTYFMYFLFIEGSYEYFFATYCAGATATVATATAPARTAEENQERCRNSYGVTVEDADFSRVGIKAIDNSTLQLKLTQVYTETAVLSALTYSPFLPMKQEFLDSLASAGKKFGTVSDLSTILFNGAYRAISAEETKIEYAKNEAYWDADKVTTTTVNFLKYPASDSKPSTSREFFEAGKIDSFRPVKADTRGYEKYVQKGKDGSQANPRNKNTQVVTDVLNGQTWVLAPNLGREEIDHSSISYSNVDTVNNGWTAGYGRLYDGKAINSLNSTADITAYNEAQLANTKAALNNANFRLGLLYSFPRQVDISRSNPDNPQQWARNVFSFKEFALDMDGKDYVDHIADHYVADHNASNILENVTIAEAKAALADGVDSNFRPDLAKKYFEEAKRELGTSVTWPVMVEYVFPHGSENEVYYAETAKVINGAKAGQEISSDSPYYDAKVKGTNTGVYGYNKDYLFLQISGYDSDHYQDQTNNLNYDIMVGGWTPDYADPLSNLTAFGALGDVTEVWLGLAAGSDTANELFAEYDEIIEASHSELSTEGISPARMALLAEAEYKLVYELGLAIPFYSTGVGLSLTVSKVVPYQVSRAAYGISGSKLKGIKVANKTLTNKDRQDLKASYEADRTEYLK